MECGGKMKMKKGGKWIQKAIKKPGSFTAQAKREGMSVSGFKNKVLSNKENYSPTTVKRANLANTLSKMRKGQNGMQTKDPAVYKFLRPMADSLMNESYRKKDWANKQEEIAKYQIKTVGSNVPSLGKDAPYMMNGIDPYEKVPTANQRMKSVKQLRKSASTDSARAVNIKPSLTPKMKKGQEGLEMPNKINLSSPRDVQWQTPKDNSPVRPDLVKKSDNWYTEEQWDNGMKNRPSSFDSSPSKSGYNLVKGGTEKVAAYQQMLNKKLGLNLKVDGAWGPETQKAYERYKKMQSTSTPKSKTPSSKNWYTTEQWDKARGITNGRTADGLPAVNMPVSGGIKKRMQNGGSIPGVNGTMIANTSNVSQPAKLPKKGTAPARRNAGTSGKSRFKSVLARKKMK